MKVYSLRGITVRRELLPERAHAQTTLIVRARTKVEALALMSAAMNYGATTAKFGAADWRHGGQIHEIDAWGSKFVRVSAAYPPGTVLYHAGRDFSDEYAVLRAAP